MPKKPAIPRLIVPNVEPEVAPSRRIEGEFRGLLDSGARLVVVGEAQDDPLRLLRSGYSPKHKLTLFDTTFYLTNVRQNPDLRFFVAYVVQGRRIFARIFYKDVSLIWRSASHVVAHGDDLWIGKGDVEMRVEDGHEHLTSRESTTDLPLEIQAALERLNRKFETIRTDHVAVRLVLRNGPKHRIRPYRDFTGPREAAAADRRNLVNRGRSIARFRRRNDPGSLTIVAGFEPDFDAGIIGTDTLTSAIYGGMLMRFRILSRNGRIQYMFIAGPHHDWIIPPQTTTTELSSYGVRTVDVPADDDLCIPGYEYHYLDDEVDPPEHHSQIPEGFAGAPNPLDDSRADASPWLGRLSVIHEFRKKVRGRS